MISRPSRGFSVQEYESRLEKIQNLMYQECIDVILLTQQADIEYYTGFKTQFFQSPTRPWFLLLPLGEKPKAIIPSIGKSGMEETWIDNIESWQSPNAKDEGISLLVSSIQNFLKKYYCLGISMGSESSLRMPISDYQKLMTSLSNIEIKDCSKILKYKRFIKSDTEIEKIKYVCDIVSEGFEKLSSIIKVGKTEREICQEFKKSLLELGVDDFPYMISGSGKDGYDSIIMGPLEKKLNSGDIFVIDTGSVYDSYFCDFDRNFALEIASDRAKRVNEILYDSIEAGFQKCRIGSKVSDVYHEMNRVIEEKYSKNHNNVGRYGHSFGLELTELPSNIGEEDTILRKNCVLTLEPSIEYSFGKSMVHEENVLISEDGPVWLSQRANKELIIV